MKLGYSFFKFIYEILLKKKAICAILEKNEEKCTLRQGATDKMADKGVMFRTSIGGFNKADVTAYLDKQNADFRAFSTNQNALLQEKDAKIADLLTQLSEIKAKLDDMELSYSVLSAEADGLKKKLEEAAAEAGVKDAEIERLKSACDEGEDERERKAEMYDGMSSQLGDILIAANRSADSIISEANEKAAMIGDAAAASAEELKRGFASKMTRISSAIKNNARAATENFRAEVKAELDDLRALLADTMKTVDERGAVFNEKADKLEKRLDADLDNTVTEIDKEIEALKEIR